MPSGQAENRKAEAGRLPIINSANSVSDAPLHSFGDNCTEKNGLNDFHIFDLRFLLAKVENYIIIKHIHSLVSFSLIYFTFLYWKTGLNVCIYPDEP